MIATDAAGGLPGPRWFVFSFALYVALGLAFKSLVLNWIIGPLWLLLTLYVVPTVIAWLVDRVRAR